VGAEELIGTTLGNCRIRSILGSGGMAVVYRGYQPNLDREIAIKVLPPTYKKDPAFLERFKLEARAMAQLTHPNIVTIHDFGEENDRLYIVMAYIAGGTLRDRLGGPMNPQMVVQYIRDVASALAYAHERQIVHRDVKPANVLLDGEGRGILSDFGIAKVRAARDGVTRVGAGVGTPEYMSPEQCRGTAVDGRADIYALGVLAYEMLTGRTPFIADDYAALAHAHIYETPPPPSSINPRISPAVQAVVLKALAKEPAHRFQHAMEFATALQQAVDAQSAERGSATTRRNTGMVPRVVASDAVACPRCSAVNRASQRFCSTCGAPIGELPLGAVAYDASSRRLTSGPAGGVTCPACAAPNFPNNRFCTTCGTALTPSGITCRQCGAANVPGQRYCTNCGWPLG
jgi:eukaryotic-like serine/threonine-protein kinase